MNNFWNLFELTAREKRGFLVVILFIAVFFVISLIYTVYRSWTRKPLTYELVSFPEVSEGRVSSVEQEVSSGLLTYGTEEQVSSELFYFDPNNLPTSSWERLGLNKRQIRVIRNYEAKGGKFRSKEDVRKMYSVSDDFYARIEPYIQIVIEEEVSSEPQPLTRQVDVGEDATKESRRRIVVDVNEADTTAWQTLRGIGSVFSNRIVRYRELLGGFHRISQLKDVYGLSDELFAQIEPYLVLADNMDLKRIHLNEVTQEELQKHPYVTPKQAGIIVRYRDQHGAFNSVEEMRKIVVLDQDFFSNIEPYLDFDH